MKFEVSLLSLYDINTKVPFPVQCVKIFTHIIPLAV